MCEAIKSVGYYKSYASVCGRECGGECVAAVGGVGGCFMRA